MKFYTPPCNNLPFQSVYRVKGGTEMDGPNRLEELVNTYETTLYRAAWPFWATPTRRRTRCRTPFCAVWKGPGLFESPAHARPGCCG